MRAQLTLPYNLLFIAVMNCIIASYFWIYEEEEYFLKENVGSKQFEFICIHI